MKKYRPTVCSTGLIESGSGEVPPRGDGGETNNMSGFSGFLSYTFKLIYYFNICLCELGYTLVTMAIPVPSGGNHTVKLNYLSNIHTIFFCLNGLICVSVGGCGSSALHIWLRPPLGSRLFSPNVYISMG